MTSTPNTLREDLPESSEGRTVVEMTNTPTLLQGLQSLIQVEETLLEDLAISPSELTLSGEALRNLTIQVGEEAVPLTTPDLVHNLPLWTQLLAGEFIVHTTLTALTPSTAKILATRPSRQLDLRGLTTLDHPTAQALAQWKGRDLILSHLTRLDPPTATTLATWPGQRLALRRLTTLDTATANALAKFKGRIFINNPDVNKVLVAAIQQLNSAS